MGVTARRAAVARAGAASGLTASSPRKSCCNSRLCLVASVCDRLIVSFMTLLLDHMGMRVARSQSSLDYVDMGVSGVRAVRSCWHGSHRGSLGINAVFGSC